MSKDKNYFSKDSQINARLEGEYDNIAANVGKCVFCDLKDKYIIKRKKNSVLTVNIFPYTDGQLIVLPNRHIVNFDKVNREELTEFHDLMKLAKKMLKKELGLNDFWWILRDGKTSGKTVKHLHWNLIPYTDGLNTWHYQKISVTPVDLAKRLKKQL